MKTFIFSVAVSLTAATGLFAQVRVDNSGNVGVGTLSPSKQLHVDGDTYIQNGRLGLGVLDPAEKVHVDGDMFLTYGSSLWIGNNGDSGYRLRLHHSGTSIGNAYIDYYDELFFRKGTWTLMRISSDNNLWVTNDVYARGLQLESDIRLKENVEGLSSCLDKLKRLEGIRYNFKAKQPLFADGKTPSEKWLLKHKTDSLDYKTATVEHNRKDKLQIGFSAQQLQSIFPELVEENEYGYLSVNYIGIIPVLVEAIKEQNDEIAKLKSKLFDVEKQEGTLTVSNETFSENKLYQTAPSLFSENTVVTFTLAETATNAQICIYDMNGAQLKSFKLSQTGKGNITIAAGKLAAGMYRYALIADGQLVDSKTLVLTN